MSDLFSISAVDRREEAVRLQKAAHDNVAETQPQKELEAQDETRGDTGGEKRRKPGKHVVDEDRIVPSEDPDAHNCDVTV